MVGGMVLGVRIWGAGFGVKGSMIQGLGSRV